MTTTYPGYFGALQQWEAGANASESLVTRVSKEVSGHAIYASLALDVWRLDRALRGFIVSIHESIDKPSLADINVPVTTERALAVASKLRSLHSNVEQTYSKAKRAGLTNRTLTGAAFNSVMQRSEEFLDLAELIEISLSGVAEQVFKETMEEHGRGESYGLEQIGR